jgi:CRISPR-associated protein Cmr6
MIAFRLFEIPKNLTKNQLQDNLSKFGQILKIYVAPDKKNDNFQFGEVTFEKLNDKNGFFSKCKEYKIKASEKREPNTINTKTEPKSIDNSSIPSKTQHFSTIQNPSFHFYKDKAYGKGIEDFSLIKNYKDYFEIQSAQSFELTTIYPGLLVGSGYNHPKLKDTNDDFQLGFFFDHTTGLPLISGSSIKGMLRSVCEKKEFMEGMYKTTIPLEIFEDNQTIFYDAFILSTQNEHNKIFGSDYITSHHSNDTDGMGMFKEPNPVMFLKVLPEVTFKFQFQCDEKYIETFKKIILDFGLGAKTNVGYGKFQG